jgi:hypothetical protein
MQGPGFHPQHCQKKKKEVKLKNIKGARDTMFGVIVTLDEVDIEHFILLLTSSPSSSLLQRPGKLKGVTTKQTEHLNYHLKTTRPQRPGL